MLLTSEAQGQGSTPSSEGEPAAPSEISEIVVTAQRRSERLQDVPIAVTAVTPERLEQLSLRSIDSVTAITPNFVFGTAYNYTQAFIRGVGTSFPNPGLEVSVATYLDGAYLARNIGAISELLDVESVQILKGPQGTLYGRNATGGAIVVNTAAPSDELEGYALAEYGRFDHMLGEGVFNIPISETVAVRFAGRYTEEDGYIRNLTFDRRGPDRRAHVVRGALSWRPSSDLSAVLTVEDSRDRSDPFLQAARVGAPLCLGCAITGEGPVEAFYSARNDVTGDTLTKAFSSTLRVRASIGMFDIDSVTAYRDLTNDSETDVDATSASLFHVGSYIGGKTYSQDIVVSTNTGGWFEGLAGLSFARDEAFQISDIAGLAVAALPGIPVVENQVDTTSAAGFAEVKAKPADALEITVGGRYSYDERELKASHNPSANIAFAGASGLLDFRQDESFRRFTPRAVIAYDLGNVNVYGSFNRGFKTGGFSVPLYAPDRPVKPEKMDSYEIGAKYVSDDRTLGANLAAFYYRHKDLHVRVADLAAGGGVVRNAASARGRGVEAEMNYTPVEGVTLFAGASYLRAKFKSFESATVNSVVNGALITTSEDLSDTRVPNAPKFTGFAGTSIERPLSNSWSGALNGVVRYTSDYDFFPGAGGNLRRDEQKAYALVNVSGHVSPVDGSYEIGFYVNNLLDKEYAINRQTSAPFGSADTVARPRTYGLRLKYSF